MVAYGSVAERRAVRSKQLTAEAAAASVAADRLTFNLRAGVAVQGEGESLDALNNGRLRLADVKTDQLLPEWQKLSEADLKSAIAEKQKERAELQAQISRLGRQREAYLARECERDADAGKAIAFDETVAEIICLQAARKGMMRGK